MNSLTPKPFASAKQTSRYSTLRRSVGFGPNTGISVVFVCLLILVWATTPSFRHLLTFQNLVQQVSINAIIAIGMTFVIITAGIDLSVGSIQGLSGVITAMVLMNPALVGRFGLAVIPLAVAGGVAAGALAGFLNGAAVSLLRMQPFIVTLATMWAIRGVAEIITNGSPIGTVSPDRPLANLRNNILQNKFTMIGMGFTGIIPLSALIALVVMIASHILLSRSAFGRQVYAIGGNKEAARLSGINVDRTLLMVYALSGLLAGIAAVILASKLVGGQPTAGNGFELYAIAAVVVGGTSLFGGVGNVIGSVLGALIIGIINMGLDLHGISAFWQQIVTGAIILLAVLIDDRVRRRRA